MAIRKIHLNYYAYYRDENGRQRTLSLHTRDLAVAQKLHREVMATLAAAKTFARLSARHDKLFPAQLTPAPDAVSPALPDNRRLRLDKMLEVAAERRNISVDHRQAFTRFVKGVAPRKYADEITPKIAMDYLDRTFGKGNGKAYNNNLTMLNVIFKSCLIRAGLESSPFATVPRRMVRKVEHFRPLTEDEFRAIYAAAAEPWKTAALISWHTALRLETCFKVSWQHIDEKDRSITIMPGKTARFGRAVYAPIHPELWQHLISLTRPADASKPILSQWRRHVDYKGNRDLDYFYALLRDLGIKDTAEGKAGFHSLRASCVTRWDAAGIPRHATRGIAGQKSDNITDLYSHDKATAKKILALPGVLKK